MAIKTKPESWADYEINYRKKVKDTFLDKILLLINWGRIERIIRKKFKGKPVNCAKALL